MRPLKKTFTNQTANRIPTLIPTLVDAPASNRASDDCRKVALPTMEGIHFERIKNIISLEAKGNYTFIYFTNRQKLLVCKTLREMEQLLDVAYQFVRIHRSFTINLNLLQTYIKGKGGYVVMEDGSTISVSSGKKPEFMEALKAYFG